MKRSGLESEDGWSSPVPAGLVDHEDRRGGHEQSAVQKRRKCAEYRDGIVRDDSGSDYRTHRTLIGGVGPSQVAGRKRRRKGRDAQDDEHDRPDFQDADAHSPDLLCKVSAKCGNCGKCDFSGTSRRVGRDGPLSRADIYVEPCHTGDVLVSGARVLSLGGRSSPRGPRRRVPDHVDIIVGDVLPLTLFV
jgi:hypothetical protein